MFQTDGKGQKGGTGSDMNRTRYIGIHMKVTGFHMKRSDFHIKVTDFLVKGIKKTFIRKQRLSNAFHRLSYE